MTSLAITDVNVFDGEQVRETTTVAIRDGLIDPGQADETRSLPGAWVLPGFVDCHVHIGLHNPRAVLANGVTTVRDLGWPVEQVRAITTGPDVLYAGQMLTAPGGYPSRAPWAPRGTAMEVGDPEAARKTVAEMVAAGATVVKVAQEERAGPVLPVETLRAIVDEARAHDLLVTSHCGSLAQLVVALDAGVAELAHGLWSDEVIPAEMIARMVEAGMTVVPTLHVDPSTVRIANLRAFVEAGGTVVYGTDMGNPPTPGGIDVEELRLMTKAGMSTTDVLRAATAGAAAHIGLTDRGVVAEGKRADLVVVGGDPRTDLRVLASPLLVLKDGVVV